MSDVAAAKVRALESQARIAFLETKTQALQKATDNSILMNASTMSKNSNQIWTNRLNVFGSFIKSILTPLGVVFKDVSPYLALIVVVLLLVGGFSAFGGGKKLLNLNGSSARRDRIFKRSTGFFRNAFNKLFGKLAPGYRLKLLMRMINPFAGHPNTVNRPRAGGGRCDNVAWYSNPSTKNCERTYEPDVLKWKIDTSKMPEMDKAPAPLKAIRTSNGDKLTVYIPWALQDTFFVPQCSKAYFIVEGKKESASYLFTDTGMHCKKRELGSSNFTERYRAKNAKELHAYASPNSP